jgi:hypothetical protein
MQSQNSELSFKGRFYCKLSGEFDPKSTFNIHSQILISIIG